jgi:hypothetical protein
MGKIPSDVREVFVPQVPLSDEQILEAARLWNMSVPEACRDGLRANMHLISAHVGTMRSGLVDRKP